ncbi:hypothetical protein WMY93_018093 [Mugilogobius chulae]|uniref:Uncharacterized protein n=1 Tax=Mugilogobius chulae TaxID=88201 RepID=A0AAW0NM41_9GOBI
MRKTEGKSCRVNSKWSRKGFIRTRWALADCAFDLVNIHLFHDASNLVACERSPSVYSGTRQKALGYVLDRYKTVTKPLKDNATHWNDRVHGSTSAPYLAMLTQHVLLTAHVVISDVELC